VRYIFLSLFFSLQAYAIERSTKPAPVAPVETRVKIRPTPGTIPQTAPPPIPAPSPEKKAVSRQGISFDYNSWFENIRVTTPTNPYETKAQIHGVGINYEYASYRPKWGWGLHGGYLFGYGTAGDSADSSSYYARRVAMNILRAGIRGFYRITGRFDLGITYQSQMASTKWPTFNGMSVDEGTVISTGTFFDTRFRIDPKWDLVQSVGLYSKGPSGIWRLGAVYAF
jgi:hypothetical protein